MGLLAKNLKKCSMEFDRRKGIFPEKELIQLFGNKRAIERKSIFDVSFDKKSAVVIVAPSGCGKTTFAKKILEKYPDFVMCSYDECYIEGVKKSKIHIEKLNDYLMIKILDRKLRESMDKNLLIDGLMISPAIRMAMLNTLRTLGYEIHIVYFTTETVLSQISSVFLSRAVKYEICDRHGYSAVQTLTELLMNRMEDNVIEKYAKERGITPEEVIRNLESHPNVQYHIRSFWDDYYYEISNYNIGVQEKRGYFKLGADYYYEL